MLVLQRRLRPGQDEITFIVDDDLRFTLSLLDVQGGAVRLGVKAPANVKVYRSELLPALEPTPVE